MSDKGLHTVDDAMRCMLLHSKFNRAYEDILPRLDAFNDVVHMVVQELQKSVAENDFHAAVRGVGSLDDAARKFFEYEPVQEMNALVSNIDDEYAKFPDFTKPDWAVWKSGKGAKVDYDINHGEFQYLQKEMLHIRDGIAQILGDDYLNEISMEDVAILSEDFSALYQNNPKYHDTSYFESEPV